MMWLFGISLLVFFTYNFWETRRAFKRLMFPTIIGKRFTLLYLPAEGQPVYVIYETLDDLQVFCQLKKGHLKRHHNEHAGGGANNYFWHRFWGNQYVSFSSLQESRLREISKVVEHPFEGDLLKYALAFKLEGKFTEPPVRSGIAF